MRGFYMIALSVIVMLFTTSAIMAQCEGTTPPTFSMTYTCDLDANGNPIGTGTLQLQKLSGVGELSYYNAVTGYPVMNGMSLTDMQQLSVYAFDETGCKATQEYIVVNCFPDPCLIAPPSFSISYDCGPSGATLVLTQTGGTGSLSYYNAVTGFEVYNGLPLSNNETIGVYALDDVGCKALTRSITVSCTVMPCQDGIVSFTIDYTCNSDGTAILSLTQLAGAGNLSYYNSITGYPVANGTTLQNGEMLGVYALDANGCKDLTKTVFVQCTAPPPPPPPEPTDPCDGTAPPDFTISYDCNVNSSGDLLGTAALYLAQLSGTGSLTYYNAVTGIEVFSGMTLNDGETLGVYALDDLGCKVLTKTVSVSCPTDYCALNEPTFTISYTCSGGSGSVSLVQTGGVGPLTYYDGMTGFLVSNGSSFPSGQTIWVYALDPQGCKFISDFLTIDCPTNLAVGNNEEDPIEEDSIEEDPIEETERSVKATASVTVEVIGVIPAEALEDEESDSRQVANKAGLAVNNTFEVASFGPVPVNNSAQLILTAQKDMNVQMNIIDMTGKVLIENNYNVTEGYNTFRYELDHLVAGIYFIQILNEEQEITKRFVKQ